MKYIAGENRNQSVLFPESLEQIIGVDNEIRLIEI